MLLRQIRDRSRSSQRPSLDLPSARPIQKLSPGAGTKRLFSNRKPRLSVEPELEEPSLAEARITYSEKRNRSDNWPLPESSPVVSSVSRRPLQNRDAPNSPKQERSSAVKRPSKFVEGSMNDRASQRPDTAYLGLEQDSLMENHAWEQATKQRPQSCVPASNTSTTALPEVSRHSSIFRFGKSIAATFNPSNWRMFSKQDRGGQEVEVEDPQQKILRERQEKAEKIYAELKQTGHFPTIRTQNLESLLERNSHGKHDSGVSFEDNGSTSATRTSMDSQRSMSREDKRKGMIFLEPPSITSDHHRGLSPSTSNFSTPSRTSFQNLKRNSMSNIKNKFKYEQNNDSKVDFNGVENSIRRLPSRKDMQKQQKLVKRVSDLESKLESARRKLNESLENSLPPPEHRGRVGRRRFVPGAMPTLHSERLLAGYVQSEEDDEDSEIGKAVTDNVAVESRQSLEETRGRSRVAREPELSPSHFYPSTAPQTSEALSPRQRSVENKQLFRVRAEMDRDASDTNVSTEVSVAHSEYIDRVSQSEGESVMLSTVESTSVISPSEPETDEEMITPKAPGRKSATTTPRKLVKKTLTPKKTSPVVKVTTPAKSTPTARKRKALADNSGLYKPIETSTSGNSDVRPVKKQTPKRKDVGTAPTKPLPPSPPRRLPPLPPKPVASQNIEATDGVPQGPVSKVVKVGAASSPSASAKKNSQAANAPAPARTISRKAVPSSESRVSKTDLSENSYTRQSTPPPPSAKSFEPNFNVRQTSENSISSKLTDSHRTILTEGEMEGSVNQDQNGDPPPRRLRDRSTDVPPLPKLPRTVRLPSGEVVDVKVKAPVAAPRASSRAGSRTRSVASSSRMSKSSGVTGRDHGTGHVGTDDSQRGPLAKSDTRGSFEWPPDCF